MQFSKSFARELNQMPAHWWRVLKVVVDGIDRDEVGRVAGT